MQTHSRMLDAAVGAMAAVALGCATTAQPPPSGAKPANPSKLANLTKAANLPGKPACFWKANFQGDWTVLNDSTLIVHAALPQDAYVIKLFEPVFGLGFRLRLGFVDREHTGQICDQGDDYLQVPGGQPPQVPITAVRALTASEQNELLQAAGMPVPHSHSAAQPETPRN